MTQAQALPRLSAALEAALVLYKAPERAPLLHACPLPDGVLEVLRIAAGDAGLAASLAAPSGLDPASLREACAFYVQTVLFDERSDHFRVLGARHDADPDTLKQHYRWLQKWLHPDRDPESWSGAYAHRVNVAWDVLKRPDRRAAYRDSLPHAAATPVSVERRVVRTPVRAVEAPASIALSSKWLQRAPALLAFASVAVALGLYAAHRAGEALLAASTQRSADAPAQGAPAEAIGGGAALPQSPRLARASVGGGERAAAPAAAPAVPEPVLASATPAARSPADAPAPATPAARADGARDANASPAPPVLRATPAVATRIPTAPASDAPATPAARAPFAPAAQPPAAQPPAAQPPAAQPPAAQPPAAQPPAAQPPAAQPPAAQPPAAAADPPQPAGTAVASAVPPAGAALAAAVPAAEVAAPLPAAPTPEQLERSQRLLREFSDAYRAGKVQRLVVLFKPNARTPAGNLIDLHERYQAVFAQSSRRSLEFVQMDWRATAGGLEGVGRYEWAMRPRGGGRVRAEGGRVRIRIEFEDGRPLIAQYEHLDLG